MDKVPTTTTSSSKKKVSVNFSCAVFSLLHFLTFEDGVGRLSQNVGKELKLCAVQYCRRAQISCDDLVMQA
jgi:hypothetical protein